MAVNQPFSCFAAHSDHLDDLVAVKTATSFYQRGGFVLMSGLKEPEILLAAGLDGKQLQKEREGVVLIGTGGGELDDHGENVDTSATMLVAKKLGVYELPWFRPIVDEVTRLDTLPGTPTFNLAEIIKGWNRSKIDPYVIFEMVELVLNALVFVNKNPNTQPRFQRSANSVVRDEALVPWEVVPVRYILVCPDSFGGLAAAWLLLTEGHRKGFCLIGDNKPEVLLVSESEALQFFKSQGGAKGGVVPVGMGSGRFGRSGDKPGTKSVLRLVAEHIGIDERPDFKYFIKRVEGLMSIPAEDMFGLPNIFNVLNLAGMNPEDTYRLVEMAFGVFMTDNKEILYSCPKEFKENHGTMRKINDFKVAMVRTRSGLMQKSLRHRGVRVSVVKDIDSGRVSVFTDGSKEALVVFYNFVRAIQSEELLRRYPQEDRRTKLEAELDSMIGQTTERIVDGTAKISDVCGKMPGAEDIWYIFKGMLLNGQTQLSMEILWEALVVVVEHTIGNETVADQSVERSSAEE